MEPSANTLRTWTIPGTAFISRASWIADGRNYPPWLRFCNRFVKW
jgi:hypothetical protein